MLETKVKEITESLSNAQTDLAAKEQLLNEVQEDKIKLQKERDRALLDLEESRKECRGHVLLHSDLVATMETIKQQRSQVGSNECDITFVELRS